MNPVLSRSLLSALPERHRRALEWFAQHEGQTTGWPGQLEDGTYLATKAKGIYKPEWSKYALSVRQSLDGPYPDRAVERRADGTWTYEYFQESLENKFVDQFTNVGLQECMLDVVPVGVFIQLSPKPKPRYRILGLALVSSFDAGYFRLDGFDAVVVKESTEAPGTRLDLVPQSRADFIAAPLDPEHLEHSRERVMKQIVERRGQAGFRRLLLRAYGERCALTGYEAQDSLEAAHIVPYRGAVTHHPSNGLLLRADLHTLFDLKLLAIDYDSRRLLLTRRLKDTKYSELLRREVTFPEDRRLQPSRRALEWHRSKCVID